jgi:superfamily II DNA or RNA helicase
MADSTLLHFFNTFAPHDCTMKGTDLFRTGAVGRITSENDTFSATVRVAGKSYPCEISCAPPDFTPGTLWCNCRVFVEQDGLCEHLFAFALALDSLIHGKKPSPALPWKELMMPPIPYGVPTPIRVRSPQPLFLHYVLDRDSFLHARGITVALFNEKTNKSGFSHITPITIKRAFALEPSELELRILGRLLTLQCEVGTLNSYTINSSKFFIPHHHFLSLLHDMALDGRLHLDWAQDKPNLDDIDSLRDATHEEEWECVVRAEKNEFGLRVDGVLRNGARHGALEDVLAYHPLGILFWEDRFTRVSNPRLIEWVKNLHKSRPEVPSTDIPDFIKTLHSFRQTPPTELPPEIAFEEIRSPPLCVLRFRHWNLGKSAEAIPEFRYPHKTVHWLDTDTRWIDATLRQIHVRDSAAERLALQRLETLGGTLVSGGDEGLWSFPNESLVDTLLALDADGWEILLRDTRVRQSSGSSIQVLGSGIDWFELDGELRFGEDSLTLPQLLRHNAPGQRFVSLRRGGIGVLPADLLERIDLLRKLSSSEHDNGRLCFAGANAVLLDLMLAELPGIDWDETARGLRKRLRTLSSPQAAEAPPGFTGTLRAYQKEGLGWLRHLRDIGLNGCLADDMGLGKTVQVLALLEEQRSQNAGPALAVLPRSIVYNWMREAALFTPALRCAVLSGTTRAKSSDDLPEADLYLITYQTLLRDIAWLRAVSFDYVILDESQAIKNPSAKITKAVRLLKSRHRLTLTGTPVENRIDDLWSQLQFLNPGMLGAKLAQAKDLSPESLRLIARGVRPFLLRRTKEQVATDLPPKVEETLSCELAPEQRSLYDELKKHYQAVLTQGIDEKGLQKSKIMVLEALLRLRQAACHPGLISPDHASMESAKLSALADLLEDILSSGHKALIFSQFTSLLAFVRKDLDQANTPYAYLDGQSNDRDAQIQRFQNDPACPLFLISLKAGGVGLNLTAADYVILLDPWWNPAIEAQAIDRAHRIGQTKSVFAYRIVARDTIEEKILALQQEKRQLADAILGEQNSLLSSITPEDIAFLLG